MAHRPRGDKPIPRTGEWALTIIESLVGLLPKREQIRLLRMFSPWGHGAMGRYYVVRKHHLRELLDCSERIYEWLNKLERYEAGGDTKRERTDERHRVMDCLIAQGFRLDDGGKSIHKHLLEHNHELIMKKSGAVISPKSMMKIYNRSRK